MREAHVTRRDFVESMMAAMAATLRIGKEGNAQTSEASKPLIDVHHHFLPPAWMSAYNISRPGPFDNSAMTAGRLRVPLKKWIGSRSPIEDGLISAIEGVGAEQGPRMRVPLTASRP